MGLFSKKPIKVEKKPAPVIKDNEMMTVSEEDEEIKETVEEEPDYEEYDDESAVSTTEKEEDKETIWVKNAISKDWDKEKIISFLKDNNKSEDTIKRISSIYDELMPSEDLPELEEEMPELEEVKPDETLSEENDLVAIYNALNRMNLRISNIESFLFRSQNESSSI